MSVNEGLTWYPEVPCLLWNDRQVARAFGMSVKRVQELARLGLLPAFKVGRNWWFDPDAIRAWIKRSRSDTKPPCITDTTKVGSRPLVTN
jgi:hypothetical protein